MGETIEQLRDELAGLMGWKRRAAPGLLAWEKAAPTEEWPDRVLYDDDPCPASLDWVAEHGLPKGWTCWLIDGGDEDGNWQATVQGGEDGDTLTGIAPTELHARLAACVAAWKAQHEKSGT